MVDTVLYGLMQPTGWFVEWTDTDAVQAGAGMIALPESNTFFTIYRPPIQSLTIGGVANFSGGFTVQDGLAGAMLCATLTNHPGQEREN